MPQLHRLLAPQLHQKGAILQRERCESVELHQKGAILMREAVNSGVDFLFLDSKIFALFKILYLFSVFSFFGVYPDIK